MIRRTLSVALLAAALPLGAAEQEVPVTLRAQSVECHYRAEVGAVQCTVRLHAQSAPGAALVSPVLGSSAASPLVGMDAAGRVMIGVFRGFESCLENCRTLVYDFYTRPQGGWIEFNTGIDVCVSEGATSLPPVAFNPHRAAALQAGGMSFFFSPLPTPEGESDPDAVFFRLEYEMSPGVHSITFLGTDGQMCHNRVLGGDYSERNGLTRATYLLSIKGDRAYMQLWLHNTPTYRRVPVRFRAYIGILTDPAIGP